MAWIESHQEIGKHPKTRKAARLASTSVPTMVGHLHLIWHWALDFAQEGDVSSYEPWQVEDAAMWDGAEGALFDALRTAGFIDDDCTLHDWHDYAGKLIERRRADAERKRRDSLKNPPTPPTLPDDIQRNSDGTPSEGSTESIRNPNRNRTNTNTLNNNDAPDGADIGADSSKTENPKRPQAKYPEEFEVFWKAYPSGHGNKARTYTEWKRIKPDADLMTEIMAGLDRWKQTERWSKGFIKSADIWLREAWWANPTPAVPAPIVPAPSKPDRKANPVAWAIAEKARLEAGEWETAYERQLYTVPPTGADNLARELARLTGIITAGEVAA